MWPFSYSLLNISLLRAGHFVSNGTWSGEYYLWIFKKMLYWWCLISSLEKFYEYWVHIASVWWSINKIFLLKYTYHRFDLWVSVFILCPKTVQFNQKWLLLLPLYGWLFCYSDSFLIPWNERTEIIAHEMCLKFRKRIPCLWMVIKRGFWIRMNRIIHIFDLHQVKWYKSKIWIILLLLILLHIKLIFNILSCKKC